MVMSLSSFHSVNGFCLVLILLLRSYPLILKLRYKDEAENPTLRGPMLEYIQKRTFMIPTALVTLQCVLGNS